MGLVASLGIVSRVEVLGFGLLAFHLLEVSLVPVYEAITSIFG